MYKIKTENVLEDCSSKRGNLFDLSFYPKDSKQYNNSNKLVVSKMKDGSSGGPIKGFVRLRYKNVVDDELKHKDYQNVLFNRSYMRHEMNRI